MAIGVQVAADDVAYAGEGLLEQVPCYILGGSWAPLDLVFLLEALCKAAKSVLEAEKSSCPDYMGLGREFLATDIDSGQDEF